MLQIFTGTDELNQTDLCLLNVANQGYCLTKVIRLNLKHPWYGKRANKFGLTVLSNPVLWTLGRPSYFMLCFRVLIPA